MAKQQTRRAISIKGLTYQRLKKHCDENGESVSGFIERVVAERLDELGVPEETVLEPRPPRRKEDIPGDFKGSTFTF